MNISDKTNIIGMPKGISRAHLQQMIHDHTKVVEIKYDYFGKRVARGTMTVMVKGNRQVVFKFRLNYGWLTDIEFLYDSAEKEEASASSAPAADDIELEPINQIVQVFSVGGGYYVDITVTEDWLGNGLVRQAWLYHNSIGIKEMLFGYLIKDIDFDEFCEILKGNLYDGNCYIDSYREAYMDSFKVYEEWKERA